MKKIYATISSESGSKGQGGNDYLEIELKAFDRGIPVGHITIDTLTDASDELNQYIIKWYPDGLDGEDENYSDPVILKEGHKDEGEIQCLREDGTTKGEKPYCKQCAGLPCEEWEIDLCEKHYSEQVKRTDARREETKGEKQKGEVKDCKIDGCMGAAYPSGYCKRHGA